MPAVETSTWSTDRREGLPSGWRRSEWSIERWKLNNVEWDETHDCRALAADGRIGSGCRLCGARFVLTAGTPASAQPATDSAGQHGAPATPRLARGRARDSAGRSCSGRGTETVPGTTPGAEGVPAEGAVAEADAARRVAGHVQRRSGKSLRPRRLLREGDWVSRTVFAILLIMSVGTWYSSSPSISSRAG